MNIKILVVDGTADEVEHLAGCLKADGYEVLHAHNGLDALNVARWSVPDLVVLDLMLDDLDGLFVSDILRHQPSTAKTPVILMTALAGEVAQGNRLFASADGFVSKPVRSEELLPMVEALLHASGQARRALVDDPPDAA